MGSPSPRIIGRYMLFDEIASGGMATVHFGRLIGPVGFARTVAIKQLHASFAKAPEFVSMFLDEARLASRIRHPNVVSTIDVVKTDDELFLVMDLVQGESLATLCSNTQRQHEEIAPEIAVAIIIGVLHGLQAAHEARDEQGLPLGIIHRDVSPQNILLGTDGVARLVDFGIAKAAGRLHTTRDGQVKGKSSYMAPEQLRGDAMDARVDVFAASVVLWEMLALRRLFTGDTAEESMLNVLEKPVPAPSSLVLDLPPGLDAIVLRGLSRDRTVRFASAREMAVALEGVIAPATAREVGDWVGKTARRQLDERARRIAAVERSSLTPAEPDRAARRPATWGSTRAIATIAVGAAMLGAGWLGLRAAKPATPAVSVVALTPTVAPPPVAAVAPPLTTATPPTAEPAPVDHRTSKAQKARPPRHRAAVARNCKPPYTLDASGIRVAKPECL